MSITKHTDTSTAEPAKYMNATENYETHATGHANGFGRNSNETNSSSDTISESTEDTLLPVSPTLDSKLSATALTFQPLDSTTCIDSDNQGQNDSFEAQSGFPSPWTPISQISAVAAEVADTAAMLDATPIEVATPEILPTLDDTDGVYAGSPIVELVKETIPSTSIPEMATEIAATTNCLPGGRLAIGPGVYATEQNFEEFHIGAIRTVQITDTNTLLASVVQSTIESGDESGDNVPEEYSSKQGDDVDSSASVGTDLEERLAEVDHSLVKYSVTECAMENTNESNESSPDEIPSSQLAGGADAEMQHAQKPLEIFEQPLGSSDKNVSGGNEHCPHLAESDMNIVSAMESEPKISPPEDTASQKSMPSLIPPHLRKTFEPNPHFTISDSESSTASVMSALSIDQLDKGGSIDEFIHSICIADLVTIASDSYAKNYGIATGAVQCVVDPRPRTGSHNAIYAAEFSEKGTARKNKWAILIPLRGRCFNNVEKLWMESDIRAMEFIKERTDIPIPYIYGFDHGTQNKIGTPYVLMDFMEGDRVEDVWEDWNEEKRLLCLLQCAESMRKLGRFGFNCIGVLGCDYRKGEYVVHGIPSDTKGKGKGKGKDVSVAGPFRSTKAYLDNIWHTKAMELESSVTLEAAKNKQFLVLLKLLVPALVDVERATHHFFLSLPEFGGGNVLVDHGGNVTGFVGWEKVMILPKAMGYARYPEWIIKDWISPQGKNPVPTKQPENGATKHKVVPEINHRSLTKASRGSGKRIEAVTDSKGVIRGYLLEGEDVLGRTAPNPETSTPPSQPKISKNGDITEEPNDTSQTIHVTENGLTYLRDVTSSDELFPIPIDCPVPNDETPGESSRCNRNKKGRRDGYRNNRGGNKRNNRGNRQPVARQRQEYDESMELQQAITDEDKNKVYAVSKWNTLPEEITKKEADEREERKHARLAKEDEDKVTGVKKEPPMLPKVIETFKKVSVEHNLERKLLEVVKTERKDPLDDREDIKIVSPPQIPVPNDMVGYRKIYHGFLVKIAPEDETATKYSHISTAVHTAITNDHLRSSIVPRLAKYVFGAAVGSSLLGMVGNGQWAKELLAKLAEDRDGPKKGVRFAGEGEQFAVEGGGGSDGSVWEFLILGPALVIGAIAMVLGASVSP